MSVQDIAIAPSTGEAIAVPLSIEARKERLRSMLNGYDLQDLRGAEFRRLLTLAHTEGLLAGLLQEVGFLDHQGFVRVARRGVSIPKAEPENQSNAWLWMNLRRLRNAFLRRLR